MRIDRYLHCIRLVKSRSLAQTLIEARHVRVDGKRVEKPSEPVRVGSTIALPLHGRFACFVYYPCLSAAGRRRKLASVTWSWALTAIARRPSERPKERI